MAQTAEISTVGFVLAMDGMNSRLWDAEDAASDWAHGVCALDGEQLVHLGDVYHVSRVPVQTIRKYVVDAEVYMGNGWSVHWSKVTKNQQIRWRLCRFFQQLRAAILASEGRGE